MRSVYIRIWEKVRNARAQLKQSGHTRQRYQHSRSTYLLFTCATVYSSDAYVRSLVPSPTWMFCRSLTIKQDCKRSTDSFILLNSNRKYFEIEPELHLHFIHFCGIEALIHYSEKNIVVKAKHWTPIIRAE